MLQTRLYLYYVIRVNFTEPSIGEEMKLPGVLMRIRLQMEVGCSQREQKSHMVWLHERLDTTGRNRGRPRKWWEDDIRRYAVRD